MDKVIISPVRTEQSTSIKVLSVWLRFGFPDCTTHLYSRKRARLLHHFGEVNLEKVLVRQQGKDLK